MQVRVMQRVFPQGQSRVKFTGSVRGSRSVNTLAVREADPEVMNEGNILTRRNSITVQ